MATIYDIAFANIYGIGPSIAKEIMQHYRSTEEFFNESPSNLKTIFKNKTRTINEIINKTMFLRCEEELRFMEKYNIKPLFFKDEQYPQKLLNISDPPILLYYQGKGNLSHQRMVGVVGTRNATDYGKKITEKIIGELKSFNVEIVSGLAYGIDSIAHKQSLKNNIPTFAVLAHGLDMIYPKENFDLALEMIENGGGILTEFMTKTTPERYNFPKRNRIIAGLCDCILVMEAAKKSGSLVTADLAMQYNREVFSIPGRIGDNYSEGCNYLIASQRANILHQIGDISQIMNWDVVSNNHIEKISTKPTNLTKDENILYDIILNKGELHIDDLILESKIDYAKACASLLNMELNGIILCLPKKTYKIIIH
ncbi:MAG: DNA-processing protein DprA [Bacteroidales bacterium]|jgi:DNA processing protein|nr:DNA-processing protein DprA [Bacteroidales bacterium]